MEGTLKGIADDSDLKKVQAELRADERLLWIGKPAGGIKFQIGDIYLIPFSLIWVGFIFFWESTVISTEAPFPFALFVIPFGLIGLYLTVGRFAADAMLRAHTYYGVTDKRAIIVKDWPRTSVQSVVLGTLTEINLSGGTKGEDGRGSITLGPAPFGAMFAAAFSGSGWPAARNAAPEFRLIPHARDVYDLIQRAQQDATQNKQAMQYGQGAETRAL